MNRQMLPLINVSIVSACVFLGMGIISPILPQYALAYDVPLALTGWAISSFAIARAAIDLPTGLFLSRYSLKKTMIGGLIVVMISSLLAVVAPTYLLFLLTRVLGGLGSGIYAVSAISLLARISHGASRGRMMGIYSSCVAAGASIGPAVGGFVSTYFGIFAPFYAYSLAAAFGALMTLPLPEPRNPSLEKSAGSHANRQSFSWDDLKAILSNNSFLLVNFSIFAGFFSRGGVRNVLIPLYGSLNLGLREDQIGRLLAVAAVANIVIMVPSGWHSDKVGRKIPVVSSLLLSSFFVLLIPFQSGMSGLLMLMMVYGLTNGLRGSVHAWPADLSPQDKLSTAMGVYRFIGDMGNVIGPITITYVANYFSASIITFPVFVAPFLLPTVAGILLLKAKDPIAHRDARAATKLVVL